MQGLRSIQASRAASRSQYVARSSQHGWSSSRRLVVTAAKGGVLDATTITSSPTKDNETLRRKPPIYKVMLHNDNYNRREYVVKTLLKVVEQITVDDAVNAMQEAHETGVALVVACAQDQAEGYVENLRLNGLVSTMEPGN